jgi:hypothetical protein
MSDDTDLRDVLCAMIARRGLAAVLRALGGIVDDPVTRRLLQEAKLVEAWREGDNAANQPPEQGVP